MRTEYVLKERLATRQALFQKASILPWVICGLGALYYCYEYFLRITPSVITDELMRVYHLNGAEVGSLSAFYYHAYTPMQLVVGLLMDRYGPRRLLTWACILCALGTYLFVNGGDIFIAEIGRFMVGFGSAFAFVGALKLATIWLPPNRFALVSGLVTCLGMAGAIAGDMVLATLVRLIGWKTTIDISAIAGILLVPILWFAIRDSNPYVAVEERIKTMNFRELFQGLLHALSSRQIWINGFIGCMLYIPTSAFAELWGISYLKEVQGFTREQAAAGMAMIFLGWVVGGPFWGWFSDYIKRRALPLTIGASGALGMMCILLYVPGLSLSLLRALLFVFGLFSSAQILVFAIGRESISPRISGTVIALTNFMVMIGGDIFQPLIGKLLDMHWAGQIVDGVRIYPESAYRFALATLPIGIFVAIILSLMIRETYCRLLEERRQAAPNHRDVVFNRGRVRGG